MVVSNFDRTKKNFVQQKAEELMERPRTGKVLRVYEHREIDDNSNFEIDVKVDGGTREENVVPIAMPSSGSIDVPKVGDTVLVKYLNGNSQPPIMVGYASTVTDRPPVGRAGMHRDRYESGDSPAGSGDLYVTGFTSYDDDERTTNKNDLDPEETFVQIAKRENDEADPTDESALPAKIEFYDAPANDEAHITVEMTNVSGGSSAVPWGIKFDLSSGEFKIVDPNGYGIKSDGSGNFNWDYKSISYNEKPNVGGLSL